MTQQKVLFEIDQHIAKITLNRPEKLNALDPEMLDALESMAAQLDVDESVRVVLLCGAGERAFSVGADINAWGALQPLGMWRHWIRNGHRVFDRIANLRQPVIAVLNGYTFGGGLELAMAADIRLAADKATFSQPEVKLGTIPGWAGTGRLPALIGPARAKQIIFSGSQVTANQAERWGLVNEVVPADELEERALTLAAEIAANAPVAVQITKQLINAGAGSTSNQTLEALASGLAANTQDAQEGLAAFHEKRPANFKGQ